MALNIAFVSHNVANPKGRGGQHRVYQTLVDLKRLAGPDQVTHISFWHWANTYPRSRLMQRRQWFRQRILARINRLVPTYNSARLKYPRLDEFITYYTTWIAQNRPDVCVIDHPNFANMVVLNTRHNIISIAAAQNFEALATYDPPKDKLSTRLQLFNKEVQFLASCNARLCISKLEMAFLNGIGIPSLHYPYLPVGDVLAYLTQVRKKREATHQEQGLFLLLGSTNHPPTKNAFQWFLSHIQNHGLPREIRIVVVGRGTERFARVMPVSDNVTIRGWLENDELFDIMTHVQAVVVPHIRGFGSLTRLVECTAAGVPVITTQHAVEPIDLPPGTTVIDNEWSNWQHELANKNRSNLVPARDYHTWYESQLAIIDKNLTAHLTQGLNP